MWPLVKLHNTILTKRKVALEKQQHASRAVPTLYECVSGLHEFQLIGDLRV